MISGSPGSYRPLPMVLQDDIISHSSFRVVNFSDIPSIDHITRPDMQYEKFRDLGMLSETVHMFRSSSYSSITKSMPLRGQTERKEPLPRQKGRG